MEKCNEIQELISSYIDNELDEKEIKIFEEHIESCENCKKELEEIKDVISSCHDIDEVELPEGFKETLHERLVQEKSGKGNKTKFTVFTNRYMRVVSSIAAGLLLMFLVRGFWFTGINNEINVPDRGSKQEYATENVEKNDETKNLALKFNNAADSITENNAATNSDETQKMKSFTKEEAVMAKEKQEWKPDDEMNLHDNDIVAAKIAPENEVFGTPPNEEDVSKIMITAQDANIDSDNKVATGFAAGTVNGVQDVSIAIKSDDPQREFENIKILGAAYNIDLNEMTSESNPTIQKSANSNKFVLNFKVKNVEYDKFIESLKVNYKETFTITNGIDKNSKEYGSGGFISGTITIGK